MAWFDFLSAEKRKIKKYQKNSFEDNLLICEHMLQTFLQLSENIKDDKELHTGAIAKGEVVDLVSMRQRYEYDESKLHAVIKDLDLFLPVFEPQLREEKQRMSSRSESYGTTRKQEIKKGLGPRHSTSHHGLPQIEAMLKYYKVHKHDSIVLDPIPKEPMRPLQPLQKDINIFISIYDNYTVAKKNKQPKTILQTHAVDLRKYMDRLIPQLTKALNAMDPTQKTDISIIQTSLGEILRIRSELQKDGY